MRSPSLLAAASLIAACSTSPVQPAESDLTHAAHEPGEPREGAGHDGSDGDAAAGPVVLDAAMTSSLKPGTFPSKWIDGTSCAEEPEIQAWAYNATTSIFRQSVCTNFEAPFMYLLVGGSRALLVDTGTGDADVRRAVDLALSGTNVDLVVAHSHAHGDHIGGDSMFVGRTRTAVVGHSRSAVAQEFGIGASGVGSIDLGGRIVDVMAIPGHEASHVAFYDRETGLLLTGDTLYPGRLYVRDWAAYKDSIARLVGFLDGHPATHVLGAHIELSSAGVEYPEGANAHPGEHRLELGEAELRDLLATVRAMGSAPVRTIRPGYIVVPLR